MESQYQDPALDLQLEAADRLAAKVYLGQFRCLTALDDLKPQLLPSPEGGLGRRHLRGI